HLQEGRDRLAQLLSRSDAQRGRLTEAYTKALTSAGLLAIRHSDFATAGQHLEAVLPFWQERGKDGRLEAARTLDGLGWVASSREEFAHARALYQASLDLHEELGTAEGSEAADVLVHMGMVDFFDGDLVHGQAVVEASLRIKHALE